LQSGKYIFAQLLALPTTIQAIDDQTSIAQIYDQRPSFIEKNNIARVYEESYVFYYYNSLV